MNRIKLAVALALLTLFGIVVAQNTEVVTLRLFTVELKMSLIILLLMSMVVGFILGYIVGTLFPVATKPK